MRGVLFLDVPGCSWMFLAADCFSEGQEDFSGLSKKEKESLFSCVMYCPLAYWFKHFFQIRHLTPLHINSSLFAPPKWNTVNRSYAIPIAFLFHGQYSSPIHYNHNRDYIHIQLFTYIRTYILIFHAIYYLTTYVNISYSNSIPIYIIIYSITFRDLEYIGIPPTFTV